MGSFLDVLSLKNLLEPAQRRSREAVRVGPDLEVASGKQERAGLIVLIEGEAGILNGRLPETRRRGTRTKGSRREMLPGRSVRAARQLGKLC